MKNNSQPLFSSSENADKYAKSKGKYEDLGQNLVQALKKFLDEKNIGYLRIYHRVKDDSSFLEKIERKHYENPFDEIEDICGIRIICYYKSDVDAISEILKQEFEVLENQDKEKLLKDNQFGYRSTHFIVKIKDEWTKAPHFRGLQNLKSEIQIRTVLMHAWGEIEHKLAYKSEEQIPTQFKRDFAGISALLEIADKEFERLRKNISNYQREVKKDFAKDEYEDVELNLDSLQAFLDKHFSDRQKNIKATAQLVEEFTLYGITLSELSTSFEKVKDYLAKVEKERFPDSKLKWRQFDIARRIMELTNYSYADLKPASQEHKDLIMKWQKIIADSISNS